MLNYYPGKQTAGKYKTLLILCLAGIGINLAGDALVRATGIPFFFDTIGTMLSAACGGALPGTIVGFCTNMLTSIQDSTLMSYGFLNILIALMTVFFVRKGWYGNFWKVLLTIPVYAFVSAGLSVVVSWMLGTASEPDLTGNLITESEDKGIAVLITYLILKLIPENFLKTLCVSQWNPEQDRKVSSGGKTVRISMRTKLLLMLGSGCICIAGSIAAISFFQFHEKTIEEHIRMGEGLTKLLASELNPEKTEEYIQENFNSEEYNRILERFYQYKDSYPDVHFVHVYRMLEEGMQAVFDLNPEHAPGSFYYYEDAFLQIKDQLLAGEEISPTISRNHFGYLLTIYHPVYDSSGICQCYAMVNFSMNVLGIYNRRFIIRVITMVLGFIMLVFILGLHIMESNILIPVNRMVSCAGMFSYNSEEERRRNVKLLQDLQIHTGDEIENLYLAFLKTTEDSVQYFENFIQAEKQVSQISITAMRDALTGVKNKAAYDNVKHSLQEDIERRMAEFAVVMADLNHLKYINDTFGHKNGDIYITGACSILCNIYKHSPVYRIGGDEFVIILTGKPYQERNDLFRQLTEKFQETESNPQAEPWERFSIAAGMAEYIELYDKNFEQVFNRADKAMYDHKTKMKKTGLSENS